MTVQRGSDHSNKYLRGGNNDDECGEEERPNGRVEEEEDLSSRALEGNVPLGIW